MAETRDRGYYRDERKRHIERKKRMIHEWNDYWNYKYEGQLSKGKIRCSCGLCTAKTRNNGKRRYLHANYAPNINWSCSDLKKIESLESQLEDEYEPDNKQLQAETADLNIDIDAIVENVTLDGIPLDGKYLEHQIEMIDF